MNGSILKSFYLQISLHCVWKNDKEGKIALFESEFDEFSVVNNSTSRKISISVAETQTVRVNPTPLGAISRKVPLPRAFLCLWASLGPGLSALSKPLRQLSVALLHTLR